MQVTIDRKTGEPKVRLTRTELNALAAATVILKGLGDYAKDQIASDAAKAVAQIHDYYQPAPKPA